MRARHHVRGEKIQRERGSLARRHREERADGEERDRRERDSDIQI